MVLVTGTGEIDLGIVDTNERIVRELENGKVINARVVKANEVEG
jgi:hypothetical protein